MENQGSCYNSQSSLASTSDHFKPIKITLEPSLGKSFSNCIKPLFPSGQPVFFTSYLYTFIKGCCPCGMLIFKEKEIPTVYNIQDTSWTFPLPTAQENCLNCLLGPTEVWFWGLLCSNCPSASSSLVLLRWKLIFHRSLSFFPNNDARFSHTLYPKTENYLWFFKHPVLIHAFVVLNICYPLFLGYASPLPMWTSVILQGLSQTFSSRDPPLSLTNLPPNLEDGASPLVSHIQNTFIVIQVVFSQRKG